MGQQMKALTEYWRQDLSAGLTTAVMLVPQGMAYALLAGLPPIVGLYAGTLPLIVYALLGTSRQLAVGPMALASLLVATGLQELGAAAGLEASELLGMAVLITLTAGLWQILLGTLRLGGLVNLLSHPVVSGFTAAAALIIGTSQLKHVFGFDVPGGRSVLETLSHIAAHLGETHLPTLVVGALAIGVLLGVKRWRPKWPAALIAVLAGIVASYGLDFAGLGVATLGEVPSGLPTPKLPEGLSVEALQTVAPIGLTIALIAFMESISAAKVYARANRYDISPSRELVAQGLANVTAACTGGYVVGGALSRTAVNADAGAKTRLAGVVTAVAVCLVLLVLTAPFAYLPKPILAAMILVAVAGLIDVKEFKHLWEMKRDDLVLSLMTFVCTLLISAVAGLLIGVGASLLWLVLTTTRPNIAVLGRMPNKMSYRCVDHFDDLETFDRITIMRMDAQFFFGNVVYLKDAIYRHVDNNTDLVALVLDASSINALDSTAVDTYEEIVLELRARGVEMLISHVKGSVLRVMKIAGLVDTLGEGHIFYEVQDAVGAALRHRDAV
ncbi:MAG TPA: sodium-independent anion transporter, partial [Myxococcales bacterium]|nr:sodium-independent anion transporter [Myxococcales bacterium]